MRSTQVQWLAPDQVGRQCSARTRIQFFTPPRWSSHCVIMHWAPTSLQHRVHEGYKTRHGLCSWVAYFLDLFQDFTVNIGFADKQTQSRIAQWDFMGCLKSTWPCLRAWQHPASEASRTALYPSAFLSGWLVLGVNYFFVLKRQLDQVDESHCGCVYDYGQSYTFKKKTREGS